MTLLWNFVRGPDKSLYVVINKKNLFISFAPLEIERQDRIEKEKISQLCAMDLNPRALLMFLFLLSVVRFIIILYLSEQEILREYARQMRVAHNNATAETKLIYSGRQMSRTILMILQLLGGNYSCGQDTPPPRE